MRLLIIGSLFIVGCAGPNSKFQYNQDNLKFTQTLLEKSNAPIKKVRLEFVVLREEEPYPPPSILTYMSNEGPLSEFRNVFAEKTRFEFSDVDPNAYVLEVTIHDDGFVRSEGCGYYIIFGGHYPCNRIYAHKVEATLKRPDGSRKQFELDGTIRETEKVYKDSEGPAFDHSDRDWMLNKKRSDTYRELLRRVEEELQ